MGNYTGLRVNGIVKPEYNDLVENIHSRRYRWSDFNNIEVIKNFSDLPRASMIPNGTSAYMPIDWEDEGNSFIKETGRWNFQCSLKDYNDEIAYFIDYIIPELFIFTDKIEVLYEDWEDSKFYKLQNGVTIPIIEEEE